jgi:hypothetical protein
MDQDVDDSRVERDLSTPSLRNCRREGDEIDDLIIEHEPDAAWSAAKQFHREVIALERDKRQSLRQDVRCGCRLSTGHVAQHLDVRVRHHATFRPILASWALAAGRGRMTTTGQLAWWMHC